MWFQLDSSGEKSAKLLSEEQTLNPCKKCFEEKKVFLFEKEEQEENVLPSPSFVTVTFSNSFSPKKNPNFVLIRFVCVCCDYCVQRIKSYHFAI